MNFEKFCALFPNGKFIKMAPFDEEEQYNEEVRKKNKKPIDGCGIDHPLNAGQAKNHVADKGRVGWVVPNNWIVIDVDCKDHEKSAVTLEKILYAKGIKFWSNKSKQGMHFFFKNTEEVMKKRTTFANALTALGIRIDGRGGGKGYICLPENDEHWRAWGDWTENDVDEVPFFCRPLRPAREEDPIFIDMKDGGGSDAMVRIRGVACKSNMMTKDQSAECLEIINNLIWTRPMSDEMLAATVAREMQYDNVQKADGTGPSKDNQWRLIAERLVAEHKLIAVANMIYKYKDGSYILFQDHELSTFLFEMGDKDASSNQRKEIREFIQIIAQIDYKELNKDFDCIATKNGYLDLKSLTLLPHNPERYNTICINHNYDEKVPFSALIDDFMKKISMGDPKKMQFLYQVAGYCLLKRSIFSKFFIFIGEGGTGKSTFARLLCRMVGDRYTSSVKLNQLDNDYQLAMLNDSLVNIDWDASNKKTLEDSGRFKSITVSEPVTVRQIYQKPVELICCATFIINANKMPMIMDNSSGLYRRMIIVRIDQKIVDPDPEYLTKVTDLDMEYFFVKACEGISQAIKDGKFVINTSEADLEQKFSVGQSNVRKWLQDNQMSIGDLHNKSLGELYGEFTQYCVSSGQKAMGKFNFKDEVIHECELDEDFDKGQREYFLRRWPDDTRTMEHIIIPTTKLRTTSPFANKGEVK